ncbi:hypothetical protein L6164_003398 [Bauhinia variegata]|uniref:Uncharacterized protein n=1 Tax=Bauhinia variegata TaxID=167791 RepID=A0ACB9Q168_BAUVA|nr:hypothetical protein L6164_003398 [Bauhinia variegata]
MRAQVLSKLVEVHLSISLSLWKLTWRASCPLFSTAFRLDLHNPLIFHRNFTKKMSFSVNYRLLSCLNRLKNRSFSTQQIGTASAADILYSHLHKSNGSLEQSLSTVKAKLDSQSVLEVLHRCSPKQSLMGIKFFIWAGLQSSYRHSSYTYRKACNLFCISQNPQIISDVIESYGAEGSLVTVKTFRVVLKLCEEAQLADEALWVLRKMAEFNLLADTTMYNIVIRLYCKKGNVEMAGKLMKEMGLKDLYPDIITYMTMIEGFCDASQLEDACLMLKVMRDSGYSPNSVVYSTLLNGFCRSGSMERALELLGEMEKEGGNYSPSVITYTSLIQSFAKKGQWTEALLILDRMKAFGCSANRVTASTLIERLCVVGRVEEAHKLIDKLVTEHGTSYSDCCSSLLIALIKTKKLEAAEKLFREMLAGDVRPDSFACSLFLKELLKEDRVLDGFFLLNKIVDKGYLSSIDSDVYRILLVGLCRHNHLMEAAKLARITLKKSIVLRSPYSESVIDFLKNSGEIDLANQLTGLQKEHL